jgi:hypothetical protein
LAKMVSSNRNRIWVPPLSASETAIATNQKH